jgi:hypothetical protein
VPSRSGRPAAERRGFFSKYKPPYKYRQHQRSRDVLRESAEHLPAVLVDFFLGRTGTVLGEQAVTGLLGLELLPFRRLYRFLKDMQCQSAKRDALSHGFGFQSRFQIVREFNGQVHGRLPLSRLTPISMQVPSVMTTVKLTINLD